MLQLVIQIFKSFYFHKIFLDILYKTEKWFERSNDSNGAFDSGFRSYEQSRHVFL